MGEQELQNRMPVEHAFEDHARDRESRLEWPLHETWTP